MKRLEHSLGLCLLSSSVCLVIGCSGGGSNGTPPGNPTPALFSLSPVTATAGSAALTLTASGNGFISASQIQWNGAALATTYVSSASLTAQVPATDLATAANATVTVQSPAPGGGNSASLTFTISPPPNPVPTLTSISPSSATVNSAAFTLTATGTNFISSSQVLWNGSALSTTFVSSTSLTAQIPASDLTATGSASISVQNPTPGGGTSSTLPFAILAPLTKLTVLTLEGTDLTWDPTNKKIYVAVPSASSVNPASVTVVDPIAGSLGAFVTLPSAPTGLAISSDSSYLYAAIARGATIQRLTLPTLTPDINWSLGTDPNVQATNLAGDIKVQPGSPHTVAVSYGPYGSGSIAIYDDAVPRTSVAGGSYSMLGNSLQWKSDGTTLYSAYTSGNDSLYFTSVSDDALYTLPVTTTGLGPLTIYDASFRREGVHLHYDPTTAFVYGDWCEAINPSTGIPQGNCRFPRPSGTIAPGALSVVDATLHRIYVLLQVTEPDNSTPFQIQSFDSTTYQLLSTLNIPSDYGTPTNFIRWGSSGLAFLTDETYGGPTGKLYLLDGGFVNASAPQDSATGTAISPIPTLTSITPLTSTAGSSGVTATLNGRDFGGQPTVFWNGAALPTTLVSSTEVSIQIPSTDLATSTLASITASNTTSASPASNALTFAVNPAPTPGNQITVYNAGGNDVVWDPAVAKLYVSEPGVQGDAGDAIAVVDPASGSVTSSGYLGSDPAKLSLSHNSQYLYAAMYGSNSIEQLTLPNFAVNASWNLGGAGTFFGPYYALDVQADPGAPNTTAVVLANFDVSPSPSAVTIYDGPTPRPNLLAVTQYPYSSLQWSADNTSLFAIDQEQPQDFLVLAVSGAGPTLTQNYSGILSPYGADLHYDSTSGIAYADGGQAIQTTTGNLVGTYGASGLAVPDSTLNRVFILGQTSAQFNTSNYTLQSFNLSTFTQVDSIPISNVVGNPSALIRWGTNGLAFTTRVGQPYDFSATGPGQLYVLSGSFVNAASPATQVQPTQLKPLVQRTWDLAPAPHTKPTVVITPSPHTP